MALQANWFKQLYYMYNIHNDRPGAVQFPYQVISWGPSPWLRCISSVYCWVVAVWSWTAGQRMMLSSSLMVEPFALELLSRYTVLLSASGWLLMVKGHHYHKHIMAQYIVYNTGLYGLSLRAKVSLVMCYGPFSLLILCRKWWQR